MRARSVVPVPLALLAVLLLAGCLAGSETVETSDGPSPSEAVPPPDLPDPVTIVTDAPGDATQKNSNWARRMNPCVGAPGAPGDPPNSCSVTDPALERQEPAGAAPAHPARDLLEVRFKETPETLEVFLDVAELGESLDGAIQEAEGGEGLDGTFYGVSWTDPGSGCTYTVSFLLNPSLDGVDYEPYLFVDCTGPLREESAVEGPCQAPWCLWALPLEVEHGAPAKLHWSVPRTLLASGQEDAKIPQAWGEAWHIPSDEGVSSHAFWVNGPVATSGFGPEFGGHDLDRTELGKNFTFATPQMNESLPTGGVTVEDGDLRVRDPPQRRDLRIENLTMVPKPDSFRFQVTVEEVAERPENHTQVVVFGTPGRYFVMGYVARDGERQTFANRWSGGGSPVSVPVTMYVDPGTPGQVTLELARSEAPEVSDGALIQALGAVTGYVEGEDASVGRTGLSHGQWHDGDFQRLAGPRRLPPVQEVQPDDRATRVGDAPDDVDPPPDFTGTSARYDLLGAEVVSPAPDEMRFSLTVADLSDLSPPSGYDAVFYAVGVEHPNGETMLGHYRSRDRPGGQFLCAPDTTVIADDRSDPTHTAWTEVKGAILTSSSSQGIQGTGSGASGAIVTTAPPACFGLDEGADELNVTALESGSYLIRRPSSQAGDTEVRELDGLSSEDDFHAAFAQPAPPPPPGFWAQPFGVENFWDIMGAFLAVVTVSATIGVWMWRRWTFKRYLDDVERIHEEHRYDAQARARALVELRRDLYGDLDSFRLSDSHYPIILDRLRARLTSARLTSLGQTFYDLPPHLALRIERMLDDGHLAEEECGVLESVIGESGMPEDSRERLGDRLRKWVVEDREHVDRQGSGS